MYPMVCHITWSTTSLLHIPTNSNWYRRTLKPNNREKNFSVSYRIIVSFVTINNNNEKIYCYFPIEKRSGNIIY